MSYGFDMNCSFHHLFLLERHMILIFYVALLYIIKYFRDIHDKNKFILQFIFGFESSSVPDKLFQKRVCTKLDIYTLMINTYYR